MSFLPFSQAFLLLLQLSVAWGSSKLLPVINGGQSLCHPLRSEEATLASEGLACLRTRGSDKDYMHVDVFTSKEGWELDDVSLWISGNALDTPNFELTSDDPHGFPLVNRSIGEREVTLRPSLQELGFSCPQDKTNLFVSLKVSIRSKSGDDKRDLHILRFPDDEISQTEPQIPFELSCMGFSTQQIETPQKRLAHINSKVTKTHRRLRRASTCPPYPASTRFNLTETNQTAILNAAELMITVTSSESGCIGKIINEQRAFYERFDGWWDFNDQALVAKTYGDGTCYAMIMGTAALNPFDQLQNLLFFGRKIKGTDCRVREGFRDAYNTSYRVEFRESVESCVNSCAGGYCPLVIGGHSQGGAAAMVMAIDLRHYNPTTITFGSPRPFLLDEDFPCTDFLADRHYRVVNTLNGGYDSVSFGTTTGSMSAGELLLLDDINFPIAGPGNDNQREPRVPEGHDMFLYLRRVKEMVSRQCPIPVGVWPAGHFCTQDDECEGTCTGGACSG